MDIDKDELLKLIDSVKMASGHDEVELMYGDSLYDKLKDLGNVKYIEGLDESTIFIIPTCDKPIKICYITKEDEA